MKRETKSSKRPERSLQNRLTRHITRRTALLVCALTILLFVFQALRTTNTLPQNGLSAWLLARVALLSAPALLTLTLPMAFLLAVAATWGDLVEHGELTGWQSIGASTWTLLRPTLRLSFQIALVVALLTAWIGPRALAAADRALQDVWTNLPEQPLIRVGASDWIAFDSLAKRGDAVEMEQPRWLRAQQDHSLFLNARSAMAKRDGPTRFEDIRIQLQSGDHWTHLSADSLSTPLPTRQLDRWASPVPEVETRTAGELLSASSALDRGQLVKRIALSLLPVPLVLLLLGLIVGHPVLGKTSVALVVSVVFAAAVHLIARGTELLARESVALGVTVLFGAVLLIVATGTRLVRRA